ncbi:acetate/propionate family kinase [Vibrio agarivorans]|uniref:acetate/propionate family kinase n=1 Tax=Vibrio agarivorans TaxID=153622 RepID=UPI0025B5EA24|nr:acetate kinase [Vibrio agarivorans]MDN3660232.1 acetate kinase [Vibrio agarivorans]
MNKFVLSINAGSSSLKFQLILMPDECCIMSGLFEGKRTALTKFKVNTRQNHKFEVNGGWDFSAAVDFLMQYLKEEKIIQSVDEIYCVGHRVAHGGEEYSQPVMITEQVKNSILSLSKLAPIHNPINLLCIEAFEDRLPGVPQVAVFDTAFHQTLPQEQYLYPLPYTLYEEYGIRKFGFHGTSHQYVNSVVAKQCSPIESKRIISCHLGSGASICAIEDGKSVATTMGYTPLAGLMMGTRCGDIDPSLPLYLAQNTPMSINDVSNMMNNASGLLGVSELSDDCRVLQRASEQGDERAALALRMFANKVKETIGRYCSVLDGLDTLVFTGGIGENSAYIRQQVLDSLSYLGIRYCEASNEQNHSVLSQPDSQIKVLIVNTDEELMIARETVRVLTHQSEPNNSN